jgi:hypothetical protein
MLTSDERVNHKRVWRVYRDLGLSVTASILGRPRFGTCGVQQAQAGSRLTSRKSATRGRRDLSLYKTN